MFPQLRNDLGDGFKWTGDKSTRDQYDFEFPLMWDAHKTRACVCDPKWTDIDCSRRMCPKGNYALYALTEPTPEVQAIVISNVFTPDTDKEKGGVDYMNSDMSNGTDANGEFALTFRSTLHEEFTTITLNVYNLTEEIVENAINSLPNKVIEEAEVTIYRNLSKYNETTYGQRGELSRGDSRDRGVYPYTPASNYTWYEHDLIILVTYAGAMVSSARSAATPDPLTQWVTGGALFADGR